MRKKKRKKISDLKKSTTILEKSKITLEAEQALEPDLRFVTMLAGIQCPKVNMHRKKGER
jgi:hypothetical protein